MEEKKEVQLQHMDGIDGFLLLNKAAQDAAKLVATSGMVDKQFANNPGAILVAWQWGHELGLSPMASLKNIAVVNGKPCIWGDLLLAIVRKSPLCEDVQEFLEGEGEQMRAVCIVRRRGASEVMQSFSVADAKKAGLWSKQGPWSQYPQRMLQMRARGFALRDAFPDILNGLITAEEAMDYPTQNQSAQKSGTKATKAPIDAEHYQHTEPLQIPAPIPTWLEEEIKQLGYNPVAVDARAQAKYGRKLGECADDEVEEMLEAMRSKGKKHTAEENAA